MHEGILYSEFYGRYFYVSKTNIDVYALQFYFIPYELAVTLCVSNGTL